ncbi:MAG: hypothetical protein IJ293_06305 [Treponema sp.]|nr:hypothetical protein [Treponema sp.]
MSIIQTISDFLESIFRHSSPEVQKKIQMKKLDAELKSYYPNIYKDGFLLPNFGEAIFSLYKYTHILDELFLSTVSSLDVQRQHRFEAQLILTGYSVSEQEIISSLSYERRKETIAAETRNVDRLYSSQRRELESLLKELNNENFKKIDKDILMLRQFVDFCHYNFVPFLQTFDKNFQPANLSYTPTYADVPVSKTVNLLEDLYFQMSNLHITTSLANMILAIAALRKNAELSDKERQTYLDCLKKINYIFQKILTDERLKKLIKFAKKDINYEPAVVSITGSPRQEFANMMQTKFETEEQRIRQEIKDTEISIEVKELFKTEELKTVATYNTEINTYLQNNTQLSFKWILPLKILKSFLHKFLSDNLKNILNDIVIEGFFNNPTYKTDFSSIVYNAIESETLLEDFEKSFELNQKNSISVLKSYLQDSHKDKDFYKKSENMVEYINNEAHNILQTSTTALFSLYKELGVLLADAKKTSGEIISNLKVLMMSSRNKENTRLLEEYYPYWKIFFEIMKNYVIINGEIK